MAVAASSDPFSLIEGRIWDALEHHPAVTALVRVANRTKFVGANNDPVRDPASDSDMPELMVFPTGGAFNQPGDGFSSSKFSCRQRYALAINTNTLRTNNEATVDTGINPIKWAVFKALMRHRYTAGAGTGSGNAMNGLDFVRDFDVGNYSDQVSDPNPDGTDRRLPAGWRTVMDVEVLMVFDRGMVTA